MSVERSQLDHVIELMNNMVARDNGRVSVSSYDAAGRSLAVHYETQPNPACATCSIDASTLELFLAESLRSHGVDIDELSITEIQPR